MAKSLRRSFGIVALVIGPVLFLVSMIGLVGSSPDNAIGLNYLPIKHESFFIRVGSFALELSRFQAAQIVLAISISVVIIGILLLRRKGLVRKRWG